MAVVLDAGQPRNAPAAHSRASSARTGLPPAAQLAALVARRSTGYGGHLIDGTVTAIHASRDDVDDGQPRFTVAPEDGSAIRAGACW